MVIFGGEVGHLLFGRGGGGWIRVLGGCGCGRRGGVW